MPLKLATKIQAGSPTFTFGMYAKMLGDFKWEEKVGNSVVMREPVGVVACITPWNYPLHQIAAKVAPALAAGCTVVLKPSEVAPLNAFILAEIIDAVGLPQGVFNLVTGYGPVVGEALAGHPDVDMVSFTGSTRAGKRVSELGAQSVKRVALELGGKSASIVLDDADLAAAVKGTAERVLPQLRPDLQRAHAAARAGVALRRGREARRRGSAEVHASATRSRTTRGSGRSSPRSSASACAATSARASRKARELLAGGPDAPEGLAKGYYVKPTVFGKVSPKSTIAQEEIFGPVLSIIAYKDEDDAVRIANDTLYGLAGGVWSKDEARAKRVAKRLRTGQVDINGGPFNMFAPFGGYKQSGHGRELGKYGLEEFLELKSVQLKPEPKPA